MNEKLIRIAEEIMDMLGLGSYKPLVVFFIKANPEKAEKIYSIIEKIVKGEA